MVGFKNMNCNKSVEISLLIEKIDKYNLRKLLYFPFEKKGVELYIVGGTVRDSILGISKKTFDIDLMVKPAEETFITTSEISNMLGATFFTLDEERNIYRIVGNGFQIDITGIRGIDLIDDMFHRDYTIDAMSISLLDLRKCIYNNNSIVSIYDFFGGLEDLSKKLIRMHNPEAIKEDPSRILRAFRLISEIDGKIDELTIEKIIESKSLLNLIAKERIRDELFKILSNIQSVKVIEMLSDNKILQEFFPFLEYFEKIDKEYPEYVDLKRHSLDTLKYIEELLIRIFNNDFPYSKEIILILEEEIVPEDSIKALLKIAGLIHDIGKPDTLTFEGERMRFFNHEIVGAQYTREYFRELKLSNKEIEIIENLILLHMRPHNLSSAPELTERSIYRFFRDTEKLGVPLLLLALADAYATRKCKMGELKDYERFVKIMLDYFFKPKEEHVKPLLDGFEIMEILKLEPSKKIGEILEDLKEAQALFQIKSKIEAINYIKSKYNSPTL